MIFISHKTNPDHKLALEFRRTLNDLGIETWIAPEDVPPGTNYAIEIVNALQKCEKVLCILTKESVTSTHISKELDLALRYDKCIVPVQIGDFSLPPHFEYLLSEVQVKQWNDVNSDEIISQLICEAQVYEILIQQNPTRKFILMRGDFQDNIDYATEKGLVNLSKTIFAVGIDRTGNLSISSTKGILKDLCQYLLDKYGYGLSQLQQFVDRAKIEQLHHASADCLMEFGDTILVKIPFDHSDRNTHESAFQFLFVANSQKNESFAQTHDLDDVDGIDSREIVLRVFNRCIELGTHAETLFIGAMGTNGLSFPYEVIVAEIMNAFGYSTKLEKSPTQLVLSVRNVDMQRAGVTSQSIYNYIRNVTSFFK